MSEITDEQIRRMAKARVEFRRHLLVYVVVNLFLVGVWWATSGPRGHYWPIWVHLGWGLGVALNAWHAFGSGVDAVEREEARLRQRLGR